MTSFFSVDRGTVFSHDAYMKGSDIKRITSPVLSSPRLILRPFTLDDARALFSWSSDPEVTEFLRFTQHSSIKESERVIQNWIDSEKHPPFFHWAIELREHVTVVGSIGIEILSLHDNRGEIGYCLTKSEWNHGYATEALKTVMKFGLEIAGFHRLEACHSIQNIASGKVMQKAGMRCEAGPLRHYYRSDTKGYQDVYMYVALADEMN